MAILKLNSHEVFTQSGDNRPEFGAGIPEGTVIKVNYQSYSTSTSISSGNSFIDTGLNKNFAVSYSTHQVLLFGYIMANHGYTADNSLRLRILADSTTIFEESSASEYGNGDGNESYFFKMFFNYMYVPNSTDIINYSIQIASSNGATSQPNSVPSTLTIMEIAA